MASCKAAEPPAGARMRRGISGAAAWVSKVLRSALKPVAGEFAFAIFALGIIGTGLLAVPVLAGSAAYALGEAFDPGNSHALALRGTHVVYRSLDEHGEVVVRRPRAGLLRHIEAWLADQVGADGML